MKESQRKKLEADGWRVGSTSEFLSLSAEEEVLVAMKLALAANVKARRHVLKMTQQQLAKRIGSSQSRVAKIEVADKSVSMELLIRSLASLGASPKEIGEVIGATSTVRKRSYRAKLGAGRKRNAVRRLLKNGVVRNSHKLQ
jgi:transcriptional regulator with XRE-family HTH domain